MEGSLRSSDKTLKNERETRDSVIIRFAGDSGDGMQLTGSQFGLSSAIVGNDLATVQRARYGDQLKLMRYENAHRLFRKNLQR